MANSAATNATASVNAADATVTAAADPAKWVADFCTNYGQTVLWLAIAFLGVALLLGIASSIVALQQAAKSQKGGGPDLVSGKSSPIRQSSSTPSRA
ncbi:MAG TPA: hypothetical protein VIT45_13580 [Allosphingosinicella sp.]